MVQAPRPGQDDDPTPEQLDVAAGIFDMLSQPIRLHLVWLLCHGEHDVGALADLVGASVPTVSQHLAKMRLAGLVSARRDGRHQYYSTDDPHVLVLVEQVFAHVAPDGSLTPDEGSQPARIRRRPRFGTGAPR
jgi:DNA-binding transcriptional ArsR family regulator